MEIKAVINEKYAKTEIHVCNNTMNEKVSSLIDDLKGYLCDSLNAKNEKGEQEIVPTNDIISIYARSQKVYIHTADKEYEISKKLYELEDVLNKEIFFRISKSELVNLRKIERLDMGITGTIKVYMQGGYESFTSRRNVANLKKALGL